MVNEKLKVILTLKEYFLWLAILSVLPSIILPVVASPSYYYAGYAFKNTEWFAPWGTSVNIYTISTNVPTGHYYAEWTCIILSYYYRYWI